MRKKALEVVKGMDLKKYMGRWYQIASFPSRFQPKSGTNTRATYTLLREETHDDDDNGILIGVLNETWLNGKRAFIEGTAFKADPQSDEAKLKVKFYVPPFLPLVPVLGDYWVLHLHHHYQYALVGHPTKKYLWILCREIQMEEEVYKMLVEKAKDEGYDVSKLARTEHTEPPPDTQDDTKGIWWFRSMLGK